MRARDPRLRAAAATCRRCWMRSPTGTLDARDRRRVLRQARCARAATRAGRAALEPRCEGLRAARAFDAELADAIDARRSRTGSCAPATCACSATRSSSASAGRLLNIHPSLLPTYRGLQHACARARRRRRASTAPACISSTPELDAGAVIAQARCRCVPGDDRRRARRARAGGRTPAAASQVVAPRGGGPDR